MATTTPNLGLRKPDDIAPNDDSVDVTLDIANNMDILDTVIGNADSDPDSVHTRLVAIENRLPLFAYKQATQSVTNSTVLVDATNLTLVLPIGRYVYFILLFWDGAAVSDLKLRLDFTGTQLAGFNRTTWEGTVLAAASSADDFMSAIIPINADISAAGGTGVGTVISLRFAGLVDVTASGTFKIRFAQVTADATATTIHLTSHMIFWPVP